MEKEGKNRSSVFRFKQFEVDQRDCPMKINTDGVLLGAIAGSVHGRGQFLDIGTGTGVIAMMLAQRYPEARVDAIEIDQGAAFRAAANFKDSPFSDRLTVNHVALESFKTRPETYDLILSNPPFFMDSLKNPDQRKSVARHADPLFFQTLFRFAAHGLKAAGIVQLILPMDLERTIVKKAQACDLVLIGRTKIYSFSGDEKPVRVILTWKRRGQDDLTLEEERLVIYAARDQYSTDYKALLKAFFLEF